MGGGYPFDLRDYQSATVAGGGGRGQHPKLGGLVFQSQIAVLIGGSTADECDVERGAGVEQVLLASQFKNVNEFGGGGVVESAATLARIAERAEPNLGQ